MLAMRDTTRRFWCRVGFLLGCLAPTLVVVGWVVFLQTPYFRAVEKKRWTNALGERLGLTATVDAVTHPEPGLVRFHGLVLLDPETEEPLISARTLDLARQGQGWIIYGAAAEARQTSLVRMVRQLQHSALERSAATDAACQLVLDALHLTDAKHSQTLNDVQLVWESRFGGPRLSLDFRLAGWPMSRPARLQATRNRQTEPPVTAWEFDTGPQPLPCSLFAILWSPLGAFGDEAQAEGQISWADVPEGWEGIAKVHFSHIDLDRLFTGRFPHKLSGDAQLELDHLRWGSGRVLQATGTLATDGGVVSHSLLASMAAADGLRLRVPSRVLQAQQPLWRYRELALRFEVNDQGLQMTGHCHGEPPGTVVSDQRGPLASEPPHELMSIAGLVRSLAPQNEIQVPASSQTEQLIRWLPLPSLVPVPTDIARPKYSPLKLR